MKLMQVFLGLAVVAGISTSVFAQGFQVGTDGFEIPGNNWPPAESPDHAIDGVGQKYLNFGQVNTGFAVAPSVGSSAANSIKFWAANDAIPRDPASYELWGTNEAIPAEINPGDIFPLDLYTPISVGDIMLPDSRNAGGDAPLDDANSYTAEFDNSAEYTSYLVIFPTIKDLASANSMQIAEVQLFSSGDPIFAPGDAIVGGQIIPEPSTALLGMFGVLGFLGLRRRK